MRNYVLASRAGVAAIVKYNVLLLMDCNSSRYSLLDLLRSLLHNTHNTSKMWINLRKTWKENAFYMKGGHGRGFSRELSANYIFTLRITFSQCSCSVLMKFNGSLWNFMELHVFAELWAFLINFRGFVIIF